MAILKHMVKDIPVMEFELSLMPSEAYMSQAKWVKAKAYFRFWKGFPEISIERSGQLPDDMERLIGSIRHFVKGDNDAIDFSPTEPDYYIEIRRIHGQHEPESGSFVVEVTFDATGSQTTGVYCGVGPRIDLGVDGDSLLVFADELETELEEVKRVYSSAEAKPAK